MSIEIRIPLLNPNEPQALIAELFVEEGQLVSADVVICTLETTKSTAELTAECDGYVVGLHFEKGQSVQAGEILCYLAEAPDWQPPLVDSRTDEKEGEGAIPEGLRITQPALELARSAGLDLAALPIGPLVTEGVVKSHFSGVESEPLPLSDNAFDSSAIIVYGGGGHGKSVIDLLRALHIYDIRGVLDDGIAAGERVMGVPVLGGGEMLAELRDQGISQAVNAVGGIGNVTVRLKVFRRLREADFVCPPVVHPSAVVEPTARLTPGVQVFPLAYVGSEVRVGFGSIINTSAVVSHECVIGECANVSPGALLAGGVHIGDYALVGMGVTVNLQVSIGDGARIGNGATVIADVPKEGVVRAGATWPE